MVFRVTVFLSVIMTIILGVWTFQNHIYISESHTRQEESRERIREYREFITDVREDLKKIRGVRDTTHKELFLNVMAEETITDDMSMLRWSIVLQAKKIKEFATEISHLEYRLGVK